MLDATGQSCLVSWRIECSLDLCLWTRYAVLTSLSHTSSFKHRPHTQVGELRIHAEGVPCRIPGIRGVFLLPAHCLRTDLVLLNELDC